MDRVQTLSNEARELALYMLTEKANRMQTFAALDRIEAICEELNLSVREILNEAMQTVNGGK